MKRSKLVKLLISNNCIMLRHGKKHDIYENRLTKEKAPIPRHNEIPDSLVKLICKQLGVKPLK